MLLTHAVPTAIMVHSMSVMYMNAPDEVRARLRCVRAVRRGKRRPRHHHLTVCACVWPQVAALLFYEYLASAVTVPCMLAFFLHLVGEPAS